jgi:hypothetical protein
MFKIIESCKKYKYMKKRRPENQKIIAKQRNNIERRS